MVLKEESFEILSKISKTYYCNQEKLNDISQFEKQIGDLLNSGAYYYNNNYVESRHLVDKIRNIKIEIYSKEHGIPHFHILADDKRASLSIENCELIENTGFDNKTIKTIEKWFKISKQRLIDIWNKTRPDDCSIGKINNIGKNDE